MYPRLEAALVWRAHAERRAPLQLAASSRHVFGLTEDIGGGPILRSADGRDFERIVTDPKLQPRAIYADDEAVWMAGERGLLAKSHDAGATWSVRRQGGKLSFHAMARDIAGRLWAVAEGRALRASGVDRPFSPIELGVAGRLSIYADPHDGDPWVLGYHELRRWRGSRFERVEIAERPRMYHALVRLRTGALVLAASYGTIYRSNDDGASWKEVRVSVKSALLDLVHTPFGLFVLGTKGVLAVSFDLARSFRVVATTAEGWDAGALRRIDGALLLGTDRGIYRIENGELARLLATVYERDPVITALLAGVRDGDAGAELVLEDALAERGAW